MEGKVKLPLNNDIFRMAAHGRKPAQPEVEMLAARQYGGEYKSAESVEFLPH